MANSSMQGSATGGPALPNAVASSTGANSVPILQTPQLGPYRAMTGSAINPVVPRTPEEGSPPPNPSFAGVRGKGGPRESGTGGDASPSVPTDGFLFRAPPIDTHYQSENQGGRNPYRKVNNPRTNGFWTRIQSFANNAALSAQDVDPNGFRTRPGQQRTSVMRNTLPPLAGGFGTESFVPRQLPQQANTYKYNPRTGTDQYGSGVLNSDTYGAGQTAGGQGGNNYSPSPGPPNTNSIAGLNAGGTDMPTWG